MFLGVEEQRMIVRIRGLMILLKDEGGDARLLRLFLQWLTEYGEDFPKITSSIRG